MKWNDSNHTNLETAISKESIWINWRIKKNNNSQKNKKNLKANLKILWNLEFFHSYVCKKIIILKTFFDLLFHKSNSISYFVLSMYQSLITFLKSPPECIIAWSLRKCKTICCNMWFWFQFYTANIRTLHKKSLSTRTRNIYVCVCLDTKK